MRKGEIARYEQFLLFPQCFQKASFPGASKGVIVWERVNDEAAEKMARKINTGYQNASFAITLSMNNLKSIS